MYDIYINVFCACEWPHREGRMASDSVSQSSQSPVTRIMTFHPTKEEFKDFNRYIAYMESQGAHRAGMAKVVPPKDWKPRLTYDDIDDLVITAPIQQVVTGQSGLFTQYNIQKKPMTVREFRKTANTDKFCNPRYADFDELERKYWKNLTFNPPLYGADVSGTLYDPDVTEWNIGRLNTILDTVERESGVTIKGVNTPYLYFGMWKSTFAWHTEDMDLYSINYLHFGEPKSWYAVPPEHGKRLERLAKGFFPGSAQSCEAFLRHKMTLISPSILRKYGIPFDKVSQEAGQFIVTFPYGYHAGFNHGFNCAESTNFATQRWIDYGKQATLCSCRKDMVKISMDLFVHKFQPERYKLWKAGKDNAPIDHTKPTPVEAERTDERSEVQTEELGDGSGAEAEKTGELQHEEETNANAEEKKEAQIVGQKRPHDAEGQDDHQVQEERDVEKKKAKLSEVETDASQEQSISADPDPSNSTVSPKQELCISSAHMDNVTLEPSNNLVSPKREPDTSSVPACDVTVNAKATELSESQSSSVSAGGGQVNQSEVQRIFQRTLSPAEVLHVHSYAKGDYSELEPRIRHERERDSDSDSESQEDSKVRKTTRTRIPRLPRHHPLMKDIISDEELQDPSASEEDGLDGEAWARPLTHLWQNKPFNLEREREYNRKMGLVPPYCAVCMLFQAHPRSEGGDSESAVVLRGGQMRTKPLIPEMCFSTTTEENAGVHLSTPHLDADGTSLLISCSHCSVRVHASCYGVPQVRVTKEWKCARCKADALTESCCLCSLRGGALHRANNGKWVHVLCAVAVLEARFVNITERSPVDLSGIPLQRFKLKCYYCKRRMKKTSGCCVQCSHGRCPTSYHPTCAQAAGVIMHPDDWPFIVYVTCCRHKGPVQSERNAAALRAELSVGQKVICKHKNGRYYQCEVIQLTKETFYEVNFDDGSFSDNLFPEDIVNRDCAQLGPPPQGEVVQVRWTDGLVYGAKFVAAHVIQMYQVEFEDGSQLTAKREDVYTLDEELPKRVKSRLSKASDMRFDGMFGEKKVQESKRQRVINSRYRGDYIEPVIYRAIME
ncbi:putative lysine-specific demethylase 4A-like [Triplophysa rosa]|uniref:[histone H3]-trimethyl-L-lysine(9) demethylase n=1 Tax=Triplophysa rosa TaxID=992332 RepID=A0A9W7WSX3_TRIRA|nr:putative lysine-specific demethylase 4A-like [Triplophysa rosa]